MPFYYVNTENFDVSNVKKKTLAKSKNEHDNVLGLPVYHALWKSGYIRKRGIRNV